MLYTFNIDFTSKVAVFTMIGKAKIRGITALAAFAVASLRDITVFCLMKFPEHKDAPKMVMVIDRLIKDSIVSKDDWRPVPSYF